MPKSPVSKPRSASFGPPGAIRFSREQVSSVAQREQLEAALDYVREGDTFTVTKLDRLARSVGDLLEIVARLEAQEGLAEGAGDVRRGSRSTPARRWAG